MKCASFLWNQMQKKRKKERFAAPTARMHSCAQVMTYFYYLEHLTSHDIKYPNGRKSSFGTRFDVRNGGPATTAPACFDSPVPFAPPVCALSFISAVWSLAAEHD